MQLSTPNLRSPAYFIACTDGQCEHCDRPSGVIALALPPGHETRVDGSWQRVEANAFVFQIAELPAAVSKLLRQVAPLFSRKCSEGQGNPYWANHCEHCGSMLNDDVLHCEPGGFMPTQPTEAQAIVLLRVGEAFSAVATGYALDPQYFDLIPCR
jgi:hypothetical protein